MSMTLFLQILPSATPGRVIAWLKARTEDDVPAILSLAGPCDARGAFSAALAVSDAVDAVRTTAQILAPHAQILFDLPMSEFRGERIVDVRMVRDLIVAGCEANAADAA